MPGTDPNTEFFTLEILRDGKRIVQAPTYGYLHGVHWNKDSSLVAINNRRGNAGDYIWVFSLPDGSCIKKPEDANGQRLDEAGSCAIRDQIKGATSDTFIRSWLTPDGWTHDGDLRFTLRARFRTGMWDFTGVAALSNGKLVLKAGEVSEVK